MDALKCIVPAALRRCRARLGVHAGDVPEAAFGSCSLGHVDRAALAQAGLERGLTLLMAALDSVNQRYGRGALHLANAGNAGKQRTWEMKQERKTPN